MIKLIIKENYLKTFYLFYKMGDKELLKWNVYARKLDQFITVRNLKLYLWPLIIGFLILIILLFLGSNLAFLILFVLGIFGTIYFVILFLILHIYQSWEYTVSKEGILRLNSGTEFPGKSQTNTPLMNFMVKHHKSAFGRIYMFNPFYLYIPFKFISHYRVMGNRIILTPKFGLFCEFVIISKNNMEEITSILDKNIKKENVESNKQ